MFLQDNLQQQETILWEQDNHFDNSKYHLLGLQGLRILQMIMYLKSFLARQSDFLCPFYTFT